MGVPISSLPAADALTGAEQFPIVQSGITKRTTVDSVPYTPAGTGAAATTVQEKLRETVSVTDFYANGVSGAKVDPTGVVDSTAGIQAALNTGKDVSGVGTFKVSSTLTMSSTPGQRFVIRGALKPTFRGDTLRIMAFRQEANVVIDGSSQSGTGTPGAAIVIGYGGANPSQSSIARSSVQSYTGDAVLWEQGSMVDFTGFHALNVSGNGINCTSNYDDNNHGFFADIHLVYCAGIGYNIPSNGTFGSALNSRHHVFVNAKAFGCGRNFYIDTINNVGSVFSELGTNPDQFGPKSAGNDIQVIETSTAYQNWQDNSTSGINTIRGYSSYNNMEVQNQVFARMLVQKRAEGRMVYEQTGDRAFRNTIEATSGNVTVARNKGTASKRTDSFEDRLQFPGASNPIVINQTRMGSVTPTIGTLAAGATSAAINVSSALAAAGANDTVIVTLGVGSVSGALLTWAVVEASGDLSIYVKNEGGTSITPGAVTIRWIVMKHYA